MIEEEFEIYKNKMYIEYAKVLAENLLLPYQEALARAQEQIDTICDEDEKKGKNYAFNIINETGEYVGRLWIFINKNKKHTFIYDIRIFPKYQAQGYAKRTLSELENLIKEKNMKSIILNVFGNNKVALELYKKLGFKEKYVSLIKSYQKPRIITLPRYLIFLQKLFINSGYKIVAIEMKKKI
ncbi:hypothetical protein X924_00170 [Petrotoga sp. 9PWA.NaAc.5.4]|nr:hypothetical protein X924_00170 [Petrotoga sp. 9PWA.NaAc.5.4]